MSQNKSESSGDSTSVTTLPVPLNPAMLTAAKLGIGIGLMASGVSMPIGAIIVGSAAADSAYKLIQTQQVQEVLQRTTLITDIKNQIILKGKIKSDAAKDEKLGALANIMFDPKKANTYPEYKFERSNRGIDWTLRGLKYVANITSAILNIPVEMVAPGKIKLSLKNDASNNDTIDTMVQDLRMKNTQDASDLNMAHASTKHLKNLSRLAVAEKKAYLEIVEFKKDNPEDYKNMSKEELQKKFETRRQEIIQAEIDAPSPNKLTKIWKFIKKSHTKSATNTPALMKNLIDRANYFRESSTVLKVSVVNEQGNVLSDQHQYNQSHASQKADDSTVTLVNTSKSNQTPPIIPSLPLGDQKHLQHVANALQHSQPIKNTRDSTRHKAHSAPTKVSPTIPD